MAAVLVGILAGCTTLSMQATHVDLAPEPVRKLALARLENLTQTHQASEAVADAIAYEIRERHLFELVDTTGVGAEGDRWAAAKLARTYGADAIIVGEVTEFEYGPSARPSAANVTPLIGVDLRVIAAKTSEVLWAGHAEAERNQVASYSGVPLQELAQDLAESLVDELEALQEEP